MLPKKKRWMASVHTSSTNLISSPSTVNTISNIGSKKLCCDTPIQTVGSLSRSLPNSVVSTQLPVRTLATGNLISTGDPYSLSMLQQQSLVDRSTSNLTTEYLHSDHKSQVVTSRQSSHPVKSTLPGRRNDVNPNLITTISHYPTELLQQQQQQPGLLLQVLPQEYLANYAQNLAKLNVNKNSGDLMHLPSNNCSTGSKINKMDTLSSVHNTGYSQGSLHQPDTQGRQTHISTHNNSPNLPLRIKSPDNSKIQRTSQSLRSSPMLNSPVFQYPAPNNSQRFSPPPHLPPRRLSGSGEQTRHNKPLTQSHQLPSGFDLPTISAVARAASMLSPSQLEAAAVLLSQWDNVNQLALLANNSSYRNLSNIVDSSGNKQPVNSSHNFSPPVSSEPNPVTSGGYIENHVHVMNRSGIGTDCKSRRVNDLSMTNTRTISSVSTGTMSDLRYPSMKNSLSLPRSMDQLTNRLNSRSSTPGNEPMNKYDHMCCPPWSTTDQRAYSTDSSHSYKLQPSPHDHTVELSDSRLAILHDAKLASLSVDWPSCTMPQNIPMSKANRIRSSGSLSSPVCLVPTSFSNTTSESSFSTNQLHTKAATTSSPPSLSSASFVTSESLVRSPTSDHCSPTIPVNFNPKGPTLQTESPISSCCQTIKSLSPNTGITRVLNSSQSQFSAISGGKSPTGYSLCGQFLPTNTNSISNNDTIELSNNIESNRISNYPGKLSTLSEQYKRHPIVGTLNVMPTLLPQPKQECIRTKFTVDTKISDHRSQNTSMPLKKRLIQRYEADRVDMKPSELSTCNLVKTEPPMDNSHNRSTNADDLKNKQYSPESRIAMKDNVIEKLDCQERKFKRKKRTKYETDEMSSLNTNKNKPTKIRTKSSLSSIRKSNSKSTHRLNQSLNDDVESKLSMNKQVSAMKLEFDDVTNDDEDEDVIVNDNNEEVVKEEQEENNDDDNNVDDEKIRSTIRRRRSRKHSSSANSTSSLSHTSLCNDLMRGSIKKRIAAVNGNLMMMVTAHAQRSTSSGSNNSNSSSSSLQSVGDEVSDDDNDVCLNSSSNSSVNTTRSKCSTDRQLSYSRLQSYKSTLKYLTMNSNTITNNNNSIGNNNDNINNQSLNSNDGSPGITHSSIDSAQTVYGVGSGGNLRKPKRTATLTVASGTTIGSTIITAKKPRLSSVSSLTTTKPTTMMMEGKTVKTTSKQHRRGDNGKSRTTIHREDGDDLTVCMKLKTDLLNQDDYTLMCENSMADELSAALAEENFQFEKLVEQLPGPPDLNRTANKSLHSTHSLNFYKRSQRVFVQLINCNDPGLKQVPKCRACRQTKFSYHNSPSINTNGQMDSDNSDDDDGDDDDDDDDVDEENPKLIISDIPSPTNSQNFSNGLNKDIQFKKPPGRRTTSGKNTRKENINNKSKNKRNSTHPSMSVFCRFWGFRKLCYNNRGVLKIADFCRSTESDALERSLWEMYHPVSPFLSTGAAKYLLECAGGLFCRLLHQELTSLNNNHAYQSQNEKINSLTGKNRISGHTMESNNKNDGIINSVAWKRPVKGVREMCDVCETTMFNTHWVCGKCGYSVCTDCLNESKSSNSVGGSNLDTRDHVKFNENGAVEKKGKLKYIRGRGCPYGWASCTTTRQHHDPNKLLLTSLLPSGIIGRLIHRLHRIANYYKINLGCNCSPSSSTVGNDSTDLSNDTLLFMKPMKSLNNRECLDRNSLDLLADIALKADMGNTGSLTTGNSNDSSNSIIDNVVVETEFNASHNNPSFITTDNGVRLSDNDNNNERKMIMMDFPSHSWIHCTRRHINQRSCYQKINDAANIAKHKTKHNDNHGFDFHRESNLKIYKPSEIINRHHQHHNPVFLRLHCPDSVGNLLAFQSEWRRNHPLVISGCQRKFTRELWTPQSFSNDFGDMKTTLIDCATGAEISRYTLKSFWDGFEKRERRITSKDGRPLCLKLKDWPTTDDFAELQPKRFNDLMLNLPMPNYTQRDGQLNLAARLSSFFVCPDLGPKLYVAYGTVGSCSISTTNLHVDIADAVNVMLYVGQPTDSLNEMLTNAESIVNTLTSAHIDDNYLERVLNWLNKIKSHQTDVHTNENNNNNTNNTTTTFSSTTHETDSEDIPGALWHIFLPEDSNGLREFLSRVSENETGTPVEPGSDPIHDQLFYMDQSLLDRLYDCTGIQPCTIVQFHGDAVFIPAGAAHQVRNLNSCIKAAVDFVSPEHLPQCFQLMEEFRQLSPTHQNHEDKLQIKNMLFHGIKDALSVLLTSNNNNNNDNNSTNKESLVNLQSELNSELRSHTRDRPFSTTSSTSETIINNDHRIISNNSLIKSDSRSESSIHYNLQNYHVTNSVKSMNTNRGSRTRGRPGRPKAFDLTNHENIKLSSSSSPPPSSSIPPSNPMSNSNIFPVVPVLSVNAVVPGSGDCISDNDSTNNPGKFSSSFKSSSRDSLSTISSSSSSSSLLYSSDIIKDIKSNITTTIATSSTSTCNTTTTVDCDKIPTTMIANITSSSSLLSTSASGLSVNSDAPQLIASVSFP
ncbi:unnamed protein product [Schistosoma rodhaini]|nr:unnamed protein product [Schistosoma rodhaini]